MKNVMNSLFLVALFIGSTSLLGRAAEPQAANSQPAEGAQQTYSAGPVKESGEQFEETGGPGGPNEQTLRQTNSSGASRFIEQESNEQILVTQLLGYSVTNLKNESVGHVKDLILDRNQRPVGMVISVGGVLGLGAKHIALPMNDVQINRANKIVQLNFSKDELNKAPSFTAQKPVQSERKEKGAADPNM